MTRFISVIFIMSLSSSMAFSHNYDSKLQNEIKKLSQQNEKLKNRMVRMEALLRDLRKDIRSINSLPTQATRQQYSCLLSTEFGGSRSFFAKGTTQVEAKAKATAKCEKEIYSGYCLPDKATIECEAERV